jgi:HK97 family phage major capsid protein/HK97 family phage prohead protease
VSPLPWHLDDDAPGCDGWAVVKDSDGKVVGCHATKDKAKKQLAALYASEANSAEFLDAEVSIGPMSIVDEPRAKRLPRENLYRATTRPDAFELREASDPGGMPTMVGHFARFGEWTEIDSMWEGRFMEVIERGAFDKTFRENGARIRPLFQHGQDPQIGDKVLGMPEVLREDAEGAWYEVPLFDTAYNRDLLPGLEAGAYGASFRFRVIREEVDEKPSKTRANPEGIPERRIKEAEVMEFGPVTFPAYAGATAGVRSMTDEFFVARMIEDPARLAKMIEYASEEAERQTPAPPAPAPAPAPAPTPAPEPAPTPAPSPAPQPDQQQRSAQSTPARATSTPTPKGDTDVADLSRFESVEQLEARRAEVVQRMEGLDRERGVQPLKQEERVEWDALVEEREQIDTYVAEYRARQRVIADAARAGGTEVVEAPKASTLDAPPAPPKTTGGRERKVKDGELYDLTAYRSRARSSSEERQMLHDGAQRAIELAAFPNEDISREDAQERAARLFDVVHGGSSDEQSGETMLARRILATGSPIYKRAFGKYLANVPRTPEEQSALDGGTERALSLTGASGGFAVPFELDPTILNTSNGTVNAIREVSRVIPITVDEWRGVSSAGITAAYAAEATETTDNAPTLVQPTISTEKAQAFVPFSIEVGQDWNGLQSEMSRLLADAKDELEAAKFVSGTGTNEPFGVLTGTTNTVNAAAGQTFTIANLYALMNALPARYRARALWMGNLAVANRIRQFDTAGGAGLWTTLANGVPDILLGRRFYEASDMVDVATSAKFLLFGDFSRFVIVDRVGLSVEVIPHLVGTNHRPTGQRGLYAYWRNGSKVVDANAFRALLGVA